MKQADYKTIKDGYLMSQYDIGLKLGLNQRTVSKAELSGLKKLNKLLSSYDITAEEFMSYLKYSGL